MYILVTDTMKLVLNEDEAQKVRSVLEDGSVKFLSVKGEFINKAFIRGLLKQETYLKHENDNLQSKGKRRCKKCGRIIKLNDRCPCWDNENFEKENLLAPGDNVPQLTESKP